MNSTVEMLGPARVRLTIEVLFDDLDPCLQRAAGDGWIAGFRTGKLPVHPIDERLGATALAAELEAALLTLVSAAEQEHGLQPLGRTEIRIVDCGQNRALMFTAVTEVRPHIELPDLASIVVELGSADVDGAEVDATLQELQDRLTTVEDVDRAARAGDIVTLDTGRQAEVVVYELGAGDLPLDGSLVGLAVGDTATVAALVVTVVAVKEVRRPALDDAFASRWGEFANVRELRAAVCDGLRAIKDTQRLQRLRDAALARITETVAEPEGVVHDEVEQRRQWMLAEFEQLGVSLAGYLATTDRTEAQLLAELRDVAIQKVRSQLALDAVADAEHLGVTSEEVVQMVTRRAQHVGVPADVYHDQLSRAGAIETVISDARRAKALALVLQRVSIVDTEGRPVTLPLIDEALLTPAA